MAKLTRSSNPSPYNIEIYRKTRIMVSLFIIFFVVTSKPTNIAACRPAEGHQNPRVVDHSDQAHSVSAARTPSPPSSHSSCTYIPGDKSGNCPADP
ncbi:hypothetical protein SLEP1_g878 [Rubroshorea leprosula]|uniref:Uncharacterized protein n=1 Tax=Rubroshorea leprosula TaxID=152421 RepID=A0AAV5HHM8_9ROSI|nr:hypothetical protein SLEP1_g878 [Rubroshorea leprosula]